MANQFQNDIRVQHDILKALDLGDYGFIDCNLTDQFFAIPPETDTEDAREILRKKLVEEIVASVDRSGPTTGFILERVISKHSEIAIWAKRIIELRKQEIEWVMQTNKETDSHVDVRPRPLKRPTLLFYPSLLLTAYGYMVLTSLRSLRASFHTLRCVLAEIGIQPEKLGTHNNDMTPGLRRTKVIYGG